MTDKEYIGLLQYRLEKQVKEIAYLEKEVRILTNIIKNYDRGRTPNYRK